MTRMGALRMIATSPMSRAVALAIALMLAFACVADVAHAVGDQPDGCPQIKLEGQPSLVSFLDLAVLPIRFEAAEPVMLARTLDASPSITTSFVFARRSAPRAPPIA